MFKPLSVRIFRDLIDPNKSLRCKTRQMKIGSQVNPTEVSGPYFTLFGRKEGDCIMLFIRSGEFPMKIIKLFHINKVSVTELRLGEGSPNGSLSKGYRTPPPSTWKAGADEL